ncbi:HTH-type transcriptional regulator AdhR [Ephemeroptericola cinctiostellae]|uniref:HTH-type transcriptional regulator AdhR n=1 Tax=Ephemeroptericola cinctiostellae TaxID=2268024 RepID=A0A345DBB9_9BURK|nr:MerR family transcriptional regulator [Ephemeroptericola cinctiostellae]AXF85657.1 HTH-type transcriptional regulator AdhR [Ephemeroptericola cinctiostellae]
MNTFYRITDIAQRTGLSAHTLRYYERIGLMDVVARKNGHRVYSDDDVRWLEFVLRLRSTGMSIARMLRYAELRRLGETLESVHGRREMLIEHARHVCEEMAALSGHLSVLNDKIERYTDIESRLNHEKDAQNDHPKLNPTRHS